MGPWVIMLLHEMMFDPATGLRISSLYAYAAMGDSIHTVNISKPFTHIDLCDKIAHLRVAFFCDHL